MILQDIWAYMRGFRRERRESALVLKDKNKKINDLERAVKRQKEELRIEKSVNSGRHHLAGILKRYNEASRARVYPGADVDKMRDQIRMLRDALIQEMAYTRYLSENMADQVVDFNELPRHVRQRYFRFAEESVTS